ncbi:efflux transporter outer membrane subunit [Xanthobacter versatilis]|uniref:efflux transporter outer membrane subunit n=1 Tax=Xanthobacter autotrophicus (strain ATCC BAA-1158 / Py2) TaxID=78245 RepID=UPI00372CAA30
MRFFSTFVRRPRGALLAAGALALLLAGCLPQEPAPDVGIATPTHYVEAPANPNAHLPPPEWWRSFRSSDLTRFVAEANVDNLDIAVATAEIVQADAQVGISGAPLYPNLTFAGSAAQIRSSGSSGNPGNTSGQYILGLSAGYMVDFWGKNRSGLLAAEENAAAARFNRDVVTLSTEVAVANTYFQILGARDQLRIAQNSLAAATRILDIVKRQFAGGTVSQLDVSQQEALVAQVRASIPPIEITLRQNWAALAVLLARTPVALTPPQGSLSQITVPRITPGLPSDLLTRRPDIALAEAQLLAGGYNVEAARAAMLPQIQLTATGGVQSAALQALFAPGAWYYTLVAGLTQPIFDGYLLQSQLDQAKGVQVQDLQVYRKAILSAFADVEKALVALDQTNKQVKLQADVVESSRTAFRVAESQLAGGTTTLVAVLQAQQTYFTAENGLAQARLSRLLAATSLFQALGGGWGP